MALLPTADPLDEEALIAMLQPKRLEQGGGAVIRKPQIESDSVLDSTAEKYWKKFQRFIGADDPASQVMGIAAPVEVPGGAPGPVAKALDTLLKKIPNPIKAYHGSPHDFEQFDVSKIGTGEGAQSYGHGLYFAESPEVAKMYKETLSKDAMHFPDGTQRRFPRGTPEDVAQNTLNGMSRTDRDMDSTYAAARRYLRETVEREAGTTEDRALKQKALDLLDSWQEQGVKYGPGGKTYEVNLHVSPQELLDLDAPLSQQQDKLDAVLKHLGLTREQALAAEAQMEGISKRALDEGVSGPAGEAFTQHNRSAPYRVGKLLKDMDTKPSWTGYTPADKATGGALTEALGRGPEAAQRLKEAGIPGLRYYDGMSRTAKEGTRNYVMFDDKKIEIVKKLGIALAVSSGMISQADAAQMKAQGYQ